MNAVISVIEEKCVGCNKCIRDCPVMGANYAYTKNGENKVGIDAQKCILCGKCIEMCSHGARDYTDDTARFFDDLKNGESITVIAAPAIRTNFSNYENLFGFLKAKGVGGVYDVSFGADITTWAYLKAIKEQQLDSVIAQPCPAIVNYVELYKPELIDKLAPVHSPMMCTAVYMRKYANVEGKIAFLSPCIGKMSEINDENTNQLINYNVTYKKLKAYLADYDEDITDYNGVGFDNMGCEYGFLYSRPGGLRENVEAKVDNAWVRQIEGQDHAYKYIDEYCERFKEDKVVPLLVDILNCSSGCNLGTATQKNISVDDVDFAFNNMKQDQRAQLKGTFLNKKKSLFDYFDKTLDVENFKRAYNRNRATNPLAEPTVEEYQQIYISMHKTTKAAQELNCGACGFETCADMAKAVHNGLNTIHNCIDFNRKEVVLEKEKLDLLNSEQQKQIAIAQKQALYQQGEVDKLIVNLERLSTGNLDMEMSISPTDEDTAKLGEDFTKIYISLGKSIEAIKHLTYDINTLSAAALEGDLSKRADTSAHSGEFNKIVEGINNTLEAVITPIKETALVLKQLSNGTMDKRIEGDYKGDLGLIKFALNHTLDALSSYIGEVSYVLTELSNYNLVVSVKGDYKGDLVKLKNALNLIIATFNQMFSEFRASAQQVASGAKQVSDGSQTLTQGATEQASAVEQLTATMEQIAEKTKQNAQFATKASRLSTIVQENAKGSTQQMTKMLQAMDNIRQASENINKIIKVIDEIAFQTNILALNANVEAARAGQYGKSFAVVAQEVGNLAAKSADAAKETTQLIENAVTMADSGSAIVQDTAKTFESIVGGISQVTELVGNIATATEEQAASIEQVNRGILQVSDVTQANSATAQESSAASEELSGQAEMLENMLNKYKLQNEYQYK